jgi:hypothetical protein
LLKFCMGWKVLLPWEAPEEAKAIGEATKKPIASSVMIEIVAPQAIAFVLAKCDLKIIDFPSITI